MTRGQARSRPGWVDRILPLPLGAVLVARVLLVPPEASSIVTGGEAAVRGLLVLAALGTVLAQQWRHQPLLGLAVATGTGVACTLLGYTGPGALLPAAWSLYVTARDTATRPTLLAGGACLVLVSGASAIAVSQGDDPPQPIVAALSLCLAAAIGVAVRNRRQAAHSMRERAERAEASRDEEARRRVAEDRLRIARELHDVIAHHMAIINVQTSVARHLLPSDPSEADTALRHVRQSSQVVLDELGTVLSVLRSGAAPLAPASEAVSLPGLTDLIGSFGASHAVITTDLRVVDVGASSECEQAVYRVVQESLTNAHRHAPDAGIHVTVHPDGDAIHVEVENARATSGGSSAGDGSGYGILGLRERVESLGGTFEAGPTPQDGFRVTAHVPRRPAQAAKGATT